MNLSTASVERRYYFNEKNVNYCFCGNSLRLFKYNPGNENKIPKFDEESLKLNFTYTKEAYLRNIALNLINKCNLKCDYCFADQGDYDNPNAEMSFETAKKSVDILLKSVIENNGRQMTIGFFGGEPMLKFQLIKDVVNYIGDLKPKELYVRYLITTNGTILTEEMLRFLVSNPFLITVSIDGKKKENDHYRKYRNGSGIYDDLIKNVKKLNEKKDIIARMTITDINYNITEHIKDLLNHGIKIITYAMDYYLDEQIYNKFMKEIDNLFEFYYSCIKDRIFFVITNITTIISHIAFKKRLKAHCNAGLSYMSVSSEGNFYRCPRFTGIKKFSIGEVKDLKLKHINESITKLNSQLKVEATKRISDCTKCEFLYLCGGMCYHHSYKMKANEFDTINKECEYRKKIFSNTIKLMVRLDSESRSAFLNYLDTQIISDRDSSFSK